MGTTTRAAVCRKGGEPWEITELELDDPQAGEILVKFHAAGLCHSDDHVQKGDAPMRMPMVGGHEGAGVVEAVGPAVTRVKVGDHVTCSFIPVCGKCRYCATGRQNLCDAGRNAETGLLATGQFRFHQGGEDFGGLCALGTFSQYAVVHEYSVVKIPEWISFEVAALVACGVPTGWGSAVRAGDVRAGQTVVIYGTGGVGMNAVQGARFAGAKNVVVVDPVEFKRDQATSVFGATKAFAGAEEAFEFVRETTWGELADRAIITVGILHDKVIQDAIQILGKTGQLTITAVGGGHFDTNSGILLGYGRKIQGSIYGGCSPLVDVPLLLGLYETGDLKVEELITRRYKLDDINQGYQDMLDGKNIRGLIVHEH
jgi:S-(hydroxymethyl)glutathione dehydrogenase/alcohol dehydrogenase